MVDLEQLRKVLPFTSYRFLQGKLSSQKIREKLASVILQGKIFSKPNGKKQPFFLMRTKSMIQDM